jgi:hypothetical protein
MITTGASFEAQVSKKIDIDISMIGLPNLFNLIKYEITERNTKKISDSLGPAEILTAVTLGMRDCGGLHERLQNLTPNDQLSDSFSFDKSKTGGGDNFQYVVVFVIGLVVVGFIIWLGWYLCTTKKISGTYERVVTRRPECRLMNNSDNLLRMSDRVVQ